MFKQLMRSSIIQAPLGALIALCMILVKYTTRWTVHNEDRVQPIIETGEGFIALIFHSRFMMMNAAWRRGRQKPTVLISRSRDGNIVAWTCRTLGVTPIRGSVRNNAKTKTKGGVQAGRDIIGAIEAGHCVAITPDGPRGPRQRVPSGPIRLAQLSGAPIIPCTIAIRRRKQFRSWDRFVFPLPFGRGHIYWGMPRYVDPDAEDTAIDAIRRGIEADMNADLAYADQALGYPPVDPA